VHAIEQEKLCLASSPAIPQLITLAVDDDEGTRKAASSLLATMSTAGQWPIPSRVRHVKSFHSPRLECVEEGGKAILQANGIEPLVALLKLDDGKLLEFALTAITNLSLTGRCRIIE